MRNVLFIIFFVLVAFNFSANAGENSADNASENNKEFKEWLSGFREEAVSAGISEKILDAALSDIKPLDSVIALDRKQPEKKITIEEYLKRTVTDSRIKNGQYELSANKELLTDIAKRYSVPANVIVALWGMETSYGENVGNYNIISSLATLAYEGRRGKFFRGELINALKIMEQENISADDFNGSWAGAFGQCQFMPSSFLKYAVDYDGDGKRDIWYTEADVFSSIANYLSSEGWNPDENIEEGNNNFQVLLKWNRSRYFATAVFKIARSLGG